MRKHDLITLAGLAEFARLGPKQAPLRLAAFLKNAGGIKDWNGDIRHILGGAKGRPGLVNNVGGLHLDDAARLSWDNGYIPTDSRPTIIEFLDYLERDLSTTPVTSADDAERMAHYEHAEAARDTLDELGILGNTPAKQETVEKMLRDYARGTIH